MRFFSTSLTMSRLCISPESSHSQMQVQFLLSVSFLTYYLSQVLMPLLMYSVSLLRRTASTALPHSLSKRWPLSATVTFQISHSLSSSVLNKKSDQWSLISRKSSGSMGVENVGRTVLRANLIRIRPLRGLGFFTIIAAIRPGVDEFVCMSDSIINIVG